MIHSAFFRMGKVNQVHGDSIHVTLFNFKLDIKSSQIGQDDVIVNFGNIGSKTIFELDDSQQKILIN